MNTLRAMQLLLLLLACPIASAQSASMQATSADHRDHVAITITNQDLALVRDSRTVHMNAGTVDLAWRDVSAQLRPDTVLLRSKEGRGNVRVMEQNFRQSLLTPQSMLERHVGKSVIVIRTNPATGTETRERAEVLSARDGVVLKFADRIEIGISGRLAFDAVPAGLEDRPALVFTLDNRGPSRQQMELDYLSGGMNWKADYIARLNPAGNRADLSGLFTIANNTGTTFRNAKLQLIAGELSRVQKGMPMAAMARADVTYAPAPESVSREAFSDYHLYAVSQPITLDGNQIKQIPFMSSESVPVRREWLLRGGDYVYRSAQAELQNPKIGLFIEFDNAKGGRLGMPLPGGTVRIYGQDAAGNMQFVGEDSIGHTPVGEKVRLKLGNAFDVTAQRRQTDFIRIAGEGKLEHAFESGHEIVLKNAKKEAVTVKVQEVLPGDWQMLAESHPHEKASSNEVAWRVSVPAEGQTRLAWRVRAQY